MLDIKEFLSRLEKSFKEQTYGETWRARKQTAVKRMRIKSLNLHDRLYLNTASFIYSDASFTNCRCCTVGIARTNEHGCDQGRHQSGVAASATQAEAKAVLLAYRIAKDHEWSKILLFSHSQIRCSIFNGELDPSRKIDAYF